MTPPSRIGCLARVVLLTGCLTLAGLLWYSKQLRTERHLVELGGEVYYERGERATLFADRLRRLSSRVSPQMIDRFFGRLVTVHFGRTTDVSGIKPDAVVKAVRDSPHLRTVLIDGVPLADAHLLRLLEAPALTELGLKNTQVTEEGLATARAKRPDLVIQASAE